MKKRKENEKIISEISTSTSTELQKDIGDIDCYSKNNNCNEAELANYLLMQQNERLNKIDEILKEINAPLIDKINKYKWVFSIVVTIIVTVIGAFFTIITVLCNLYNTNIENQFKNIQSQTVENSQEIKELNLEIKELNKKNNTLEIKLIEKMQNNK